MSPSAPPVADGVGRGLCRGAGQRPPLGREHIPPVHLEPGDACTARGRFALNAEAAAESPTPLLHAAAAACMPACSCKAYCRT